MNQPLHYVDLYKDIENRLKVAMLLRTTGNSVKETMEAIKPKIEDTTIESLTEELSILLVYVADMELQAANPKENS